MNCSTFRALLEYNSDSFYAHIGRATALWRGRLPHAANQGDAHTRFQSLMRSLTDTDAFPTLRGTFAATMFPEIRAASTL
jgi:hypothetical protein